MMDRSTRHCHTEHAQHNNSNELALHDGENSFLHQQQLASSSESRRRGIPARVLAPVVDVVADNRIGQRRPSRVRLFSDVAYIPTPLWTIV